MDPAWGRGLVLDHSSSEDEQIDPAWGLLPENATSQPSSMAVPSTTVAPEPGACGVLAAASPEIPKSIQNTLSETSLWGDAPLQPYIQNVLEQVGSQESSSAELDPVIPKLSEFYLHSEARLHTTKVAMAQVTHTPAELIEERLALLVNTLLHMENGHRLSFERIIATSGADLVAYAEFTKFDETPMKVGQKQTLHTLASTAIATPPCSSSSADVNPASLFTCTDLP